MIINHFINQKAFVIVWNYCKELLSLETLKESFKVDKFKLWIITVNNITTQRANDLKQKLIEIKELQKKSEI